ncbi:uncharacterized protein MYCFIDRAFT_182517 [Pseudocercospora fijiensis CIRAD86]|uniref:Uncharacterized protein n=1 Tax=Pseudocercospora fijiensis (strain CIRAD86) TaxID=383855 RepID=M3B6Y2_PSEFD|nr:uncharacterized protein MYCFIDRAFT_182517 [Pseudocercospora fijiensis CIRAD86]EME85097.1 hypothetical protein MYCFIDRAFT_182517 [Pseudocercospora fijiensis CIRAD86]
MGEKEGDLVNLTFPLALCLVLGDTRCTSHMYLGVFDDCANSEQAFVHLLQCDHSQTK